jgi:hypothetical protein
MSSMDRPLINAIVTSYSYGIVVIPAKAGIQREKNWIPCQARNDVISDIIYERVNNYRFTLK